MASGTGKKALFCGACGLALLTAACGPKEPPRPAPPPPQPAIVIPPRPYPPSGASPNLALPQIGADGLFRSVNRGISPVQITWNLRSAFNVGALNCAEPARTEITNAYRTFLRAHSRRLTAVNKAVDAEFRATHGSRYIAVRETYTTEVYNHYAFPPTLGAFCATVLGMSREVAAVKPADLDAFAARSLPAIEGVFDDFYLRYANYRSDLATWEARYGAYVNPQASVSSVQTRAQ